MVGTVTRPSPSSNYATQMQHIVASAEGFLAAAIHHQHGKGKPAVVFDIDDTLLNTYDYEIANQFGFTPASNAVFVNAAAFPAVFYMPGLVSFAASHGYAVFFITGRPQTQTSATVTNLTNAGLPGSPGRAPVLKQPATTPSYLHCANAPTCTTIEYKSGTRAHIASLGYSIMADFGDQYSDLLGGNAGTRSRSPTRCTTSPDPHRGPAPDRQDRAGRALAARTPGGRRGFGLLRLMPDLRALSSRLLPTSVMQGSVTPSSSADYPRGG